MKFQIHTIVSKPFEENTYVLWIPKQPECIVVDPGMEPEKILQFLQEQQLTVQAIWNTHGHIDHIAGNDRLKTQYPTAPLLIGHTDAAMLTDPALNLSLFHGQPYISPAADQLLHEGDQITALATNWLVREIPGHSPGHIVFIDQTHSPAIVLGGDVLFQGSVGRWDFPGGDGRLLISGIKEKLYCLPPETIVFPGHGPATTIGVETATNPITSARPEELPF